MSRFRPGSGGVACVPRQIRVEDSPRHAHLAGFPVNVVYTRIDLSKTAHALPRVSASIYWPDVATYWEDDETRALHYRPREESPYSVHVTSEKATRSWAVFKLRGTAIVARSRGADFRGAMLNATLVGVADDEPISDLRDQS